MTKRPDLASVIQGWVEKAEHDYETGNLILNSQKEQLADVACYHAQ
jgi:hypothetical protein